MSVHKTQDKVNPTKISTANIRGAQIFQKFEATSKFEVPET